VDRSIEPVQLPTSPAITTAAETWIALL